MIFLVIPRNLSEIKFLYKERESISFFLSLALKTQSNHWTKRMVNAQLTT